MKMLFGLMLALIVTQSMAADYSGNTNSFNGNAGAVFSSDAITIIDMDAGAKFCGPATLVNGGPLITIPKGSCITAASRTKISLPPPSSQCVIVDAVNNGTIEQDCSESGAAR